MLKLFQFTVWIFVSWQTVLVQVEDNLGVDLLAAFILGGLCAYWATGFLILFGIAASRCPALVHRTLRRLLLLKQPQLPRRVWDARRLLR